MSRRLTERRSFALLLGDMDGLKVINDSRGHAEGNGIAALRLCSVPRFAPRTKVARVGGDEFAVLSSVHSSEEAGQLAERLEAAVAAEGAGVHLGWAVSPGEEVQALTLSGPPTSVSTSGSPVSETASRVPLRLAAP